LAVLPNDAAFPYDHIVSQLREGRVPFILLQEGIRFPLPGTEPNRAYGTGGAEAIAAWGAASAEYFRSVGAAADRVFLTGNPRFDGLKATNWSKVGAELKSRLGLRGECLLLLSNPIDDLGFCSRREKLALIRSFVASIRPRLDGGDLTLLLRLHGSESEDAILCALQPLGLGERVRVVTGSALYSLLSIASGAVIMASTVGLEALLLGVPLAVLRIPRVGYVHDYVSAGAGLPVDPDAPSPGAIDELLAAWHASSREKVAAYVSRHLSHREDSTERVVGVITRVLGGQ